MVHRKILWNKAQPEYADYGKREQEWDQVTAQLDIPYVELMALSFHWLRALNRGRINRATSGKILPNHPFLRQLLDGMLCYNMKFRKDQVLPRSKRSKKEDGEAAGGDNGDGEGK